MPVSLKNEINSVVTKIQFAENNPSSTCVHINDCYFVYRVCVKYVLFPS